MSQISNALAGRWGWGRTGQLAWQADRNLPPVRFLAATETQGLLLYEAGCLRRLLPGRFYGITRNGDWWYAFQRGGDRSRVLRLYLDEGKVARVETVLRRSREVYPAGLGSVAGCRQENLRPSADVGQYCHFNSIYRWAGQIFLVAHNKTRARGGRSELFVLDQDFACQDVRALDAADVHNYPTDGTREIFCASAKGTLRCGGSDAVSLHSYVRGLSVASDYLMAGASLSAGSRQKREAGDARIHILGTDFSYLGCLVIRRTQIYEIRRLDVPELTLSNSAARSAPHRPAADVKTNAT